MSSRSFSRPACRSSEARADDKKWGRDARCEVEVLVGVPHLRVDRRERWSRGATPATPSLALHERRAVRQIAQKRPRHAAGPLRFSRNDLASGGEDTVDMCELEEPHVSHTLGPARQPSRCRRRSRDVEESRCTGRLAPGAAHAVLGCWRDVHTGLAPSGYRAPQKKKKPYSYETLLRGAGEHVYRLPNRSRRTPLDRRLRDERSIAIAFSGWRSEARLGRRR